MVSLPRAVTRPNHVTVVSVTSLQWIRQALVLILLSQLATGVTLLVIVGRLPWR